MQKTFGILTLFVILLTSTVSGQDVSFTASAKNVVRTGERFRLTYTINAEGKNFRGPSFEGFQVLSGPSTSQSSSIQIINGSVTRNVEYTYTFIVQATKEGDFKIDPASITVDGNEVKSNLLSIKVTQGGASQGGSADQSQSAGDENDFSDDVFIRAMADKASPYQGEQVIITYKLYYRINIASPEFKKEPNFKGFWVNNLLKNQQNYTQYQENYRGQRYHVAELKKIALFPQRSGKLSITPLEASVQAQVQSKTNKRSRDPFDNFFNDPFFNRYRNVEVPLVSNGLTLNVKPLPGKNKPADFNGAVGNFDFSSSIDNTELKTNEALTLKFTVSGAGNIELVDRINVNFPPDFEVYDPKISKNINASQNGVSGRKVFEYIVIPRTPGDFVIDPVKFTYYDLSKNSYVIHSSPAYEIKVAKGDGTQADISYSGVNQSDIKYIGSDIRYIKTNTRSLQLTGSYFFGSTWFYLLMVLPLALFVAFVLLWKNELKKRSNIALMRNRKATKIARKRLKKAESLLKENNKEQFYVEVSQALWGYLSDKFSIPLSRLSIDTVADTLQRKEVSDEIINRIIETLNNCEFARFAPGENQGAMEQVYKEGVEIISKMESELK